MRVRNRYWLLSNRLGPARAVAPLLLCVLLLATAAAAQSTAEQSIRDVLDRQATAWNRGDLEGYMAGYARTPELSFYSGGTVTSGWEATLARYQKRYQGAGHEMGKLDFSQLEVHLLGRDAAWVGGRWHLKMSDGKDLGGLFTLIFRKRAEGWRIVHDHTSSE
jgi:ketosteroid isomerase-like protein